MATSNSNYDNRHTTSTHVTPPQIGQAPEAPHLAGPAPAYSAATSGKADPERGAASVECGGSQLPAGHAPGRLLSGGEAIATLDRIEGHLLAGIREQEDLRRALRVSLDYIEAQEPGFRPWPVRAYRRLVAGK